MEVLTSIPLQRCGGAISRSQQPLRFGVPLSAGQFQPECECRVRNFQHDVFPTQKQVFASWPDESARWLAVDTILPANHSTDEPLFVDLCSPSKPKPECEPSLACVDGDQVSWHFAEDKPLFRFTNTINQVSSDWSFEFSDASAETCEFKLHRRFVEEAGDVQITVCEEGTVVGHPHLFWRARIRCYPKLNATKVHIVLRNTRRSNHSGGLWDLGDPGSSFIRRFGLRESGQHADRVWMKTDPSANMQLFEGKSLTFRQTSSGGANWDSPNHIGCHGTTTVEANEGQIICDEQIAPHPRLLPTLATASQNAALYITMPEFWQRFPNQLKWQQEHGCLVSFLPEQKHLHELQGGEQLSKELWLSWNQDQPGNSDPLAWVHDPIVATVDPKQITETKAFVWFPETWPETSPSSALAEYLPKVVEGENSLFAKRELIDEYSWRNFGDLYADHENRGNTGPNLRISHYNNQYDVLLGLLWHGLRSNGQRWFDLATALARHVVDIDLYHTQQDKPGYNGGFFWHTDHYCDAATSTHRCHSSQNQSPGVPYGGGPSCEHNYPTGLLLFHYLFGDPEAAEAVKLLADWVVNMEEGTGSVWSLFDGQPTGAASSTFESGFIGPGRGAGNSINALLDGFLLTNQPHYLAAAERMIRRTIHPEDDIAALDLLNVEARWSYTVYLNVLGRFLAVKQSDHQLDAMFAYAQHALCEYANWVAKHEQFYLDHPEKLEYPTETWAAQEFRKANLLRLAAFYAAESFTSHIDVWKTRADEISTRAWEQLLAFDSHLVTRAMAIVMTEGWKDYSLSKSPQVKPELPQLAVELPPKESFLPLKARLKKKLTSPISWVEIAAMFPYRAIKWATYK